MYAGTSYGKVLEHPLMAYHLDMRPPSYGIGFSQLALPIAAATGPAAPFVAAALIAAPYIAKILAKTLKGCGDSCTLTSDAANEVEQLLIQNLRMYEASGHTLVEQQAALDYFDLVWGQLVEFCGQPQFQNNKAGRNCVADRQRGACKWKNGDVCWNWFIGYRDPIANDPGVKPNAIASGGVEDVVGDVGKSITDAFQGKDSSTLLIVVGALALVYIAS